jgi:hypothetical protein
MKAGMEKVMEEKVKEKMTKMEEQKNEVNYCFLNLSRFYPLISSYIIQDYFMTNVF